MADMVQVQEQSRKSFFHWHLLLIMKKKELQQTLSDAGVRPDIVNEIEAEQPPVVDSEELGLLLRLGLPIPDDLSPYDLPQHDPVAGIQFLFRAAPAFDIADDFVLDFVRQRVDGKYERMELMRVAYHNREYLVKVALKFNQALQGYSTQLVLTAAKIWADFHDAVVMPWQAVSARLLDLDEQQIISEPHTVTKKPPRINLNGRKTLFGDS